MEEDVIHLGEVAQKVRKRWPTIMAWSIGLGVVAGLITWIIPPVYQAQATLVLPQMDSGMGQLALLQMKSAADPVSILGGVVESHATKVEIAKATDKKLDELKGAYEVETDNAQAQIRIKFKDVKPEVAKQAVEVALKTAEKLDKALGLNVAATQAVNLKPAVETAAKELAAAEDELLAYQRETKTVATESDNFTGANYLKKLQELDAQLRAADTQWNAVRSVVKSKANRTDDLPTGVENIDTVREKLVEAETKLAIARSKFTESSTQVQQAKDTRDALQQTLRIEASKYAASIDESVNKDAVDLQVRRMVLRAQVDAARKLAERAPGEALEFQRLLRKARTASEKFNQVNLRYETAKVEAQASRVKWAVLDAPFLKEKPINKGYKLNMIVAGILGFLASVAMTTRRGA